MNAGPLQWDFFEHLPVVLQEATTGEVLMIQYMTKEGLEPVAARGDGPSK